MKRLVFSIFLFCVLSLPEFLLAQAVSFYSPIEWLTQRNGQMVAKVQFDTSKVSKKNVQFTLSLVTNGKKKRIASKSIMVKEYSADIELGVIDRTILGGRDFAAIEWTIPQTKERGIIGPVGIVNLQKIMPFDSLIAKKIAEGTARSAVAGNFTDGDFTTIGSVSVAFAWNQKGLYLVCKGKGEGAGLTLGIDAKNAKNGYLSYSDRFISYSFGKDSLWVSNYKRVFVNDSIKYNLAEWYSAISREVLAGVVTIEIPWYDIGMIAPTGDRRIGIGIFIEHEKGTPASTFPQEGANREIPGSWGDLVFKE